MIQKKKGEKWDEIEGDAGGTLVAKYRTSVGGGGEGRRVDRLGTGPGPGPLLISRTRVFRGAEPGKRVP